MKILNNRRQRILANFLTTVLLTMSCFSSGFVTEAVTKKTGSSVTLVKPEITSLTLKEGTRYQLKTKAGSKTASGKGLRYRSSRPSVVSVSKNGKLKAEKCGKATISVKSVTGKKQINVQVKVVKRLKKVKKVTLSAKKVVLYVGGEQKEAQTVLTAKVSPKKATVKNVIYKVTDKNIASVSKKGVVKAKKEGKTKITVFAADGWGKKAVCEVTVKKKVSPLFTPANTDVSATPTLPSGKTEKPTPTEKPAKDYMLADSGKAQRLYLDAEGADYNGLRLVAECFQKDVKMVSDAELDIVTDVGQIAGIPIIAGSIGNNGLIDNMIEHGRLDVSEIKGKWETYKIDFVEHPVEGVEEALVVAGSDKRGTIYGIFHISELMGVSPWVYWADVTPEKKDTISLNSKTLCVTSKEPSVKYRGIFLNDEEPALGSWANNFFKKSKGGKFNEYFYENVFQLILRLKGNYLWPAMWSSAFSTDGVEIPEASAQLADEYGIVMGTSHHEPMMKAHQEWSKGKLNYGNGEWNYDTNKEGLKKFFTEGAERNGKYENVIIEAGNYTDSNAAADGAAWKEIKNYGRGRSSLKVFPCTGRFTDVEDAPYVEYTVKTASTDKYSLMAYMAPSNNVDWNYVTMKFGISVDEGEVQSVDTISKNYIAGTWRDSLWSNGVKNGIHTKKVSLGKLSAGIHKIRIYSMDPEIVLQKFVLHPTNKNLKNSYMGPGESYYVGKEVSSQ